MASVVDICNLALSLLGQDQIVSFDEDTPQALACRTHWKMLRDETLRGHPWNFARKRALLNRLSDAPAFGYKYYYQLPADYLDVYQVEPNQEFEVEGRLLLTDAEEVRLKYIQSLDDSTVYDAQFSVAIAYLLASQLAYPVTSSTTNVQTFTKIGSDKLLDAKASNAFEGKQKDKRGNRLLRAKYG